MDVYIQHQQILFPRALPENELRRLQSNSRERAKGRVAIELTYDGCAQQKDLVALFSLVPEDVGFVGLCFVNHRSSPVQDINHQYRTLCVWTDACYQQGRVYKFCQ
jgi:hypothetical protein